MARGTRPDHHLSATKKLFRTMVYVTRTRVGEECFDSVTNVGNGLPSG